MKYKILVVDDDINFLGTVEEKLVRDNYRVITATNGVEGLKKAKEEEPDLLILDAMLPGVDGFELCHRLRNMAPTAQLPILMLSAKARADDRSMGLKVGADEFLAKPVPLPELAATIAKLLARRGAAPAAKGMTIGFIGSEGGVGTSTVVVNVALALAGESSAIVVDLCPHSSTLPLTLAIEGEHTISHLVEKGIDREGLEALLIEHSTGLRVLTTPQDRDDYSRVAPSHMEALLHELRGMAHYILIDTPAHANDVTKAALQGCDLVTLVANSDPQSMSSIEFAAAFLTRLGIDKQRLGLVLIDRDQRFEGTKLPTAMADMPLIGIIPYDTKTCLDAEERRMPVILAEPSSSLASALTKLAQQLVSHGGPVEEHQVIEHLSFRPPRQEWKR